LNILVASGATQVVRRSEWLPLALLAGAIVVLHVLFLRSGHDWADDYAMYLSHANNLLSGRPYADTGFVPNPWAVPGPPTYPPVYPLMIAPIVAMWGQDLQALKVFGVVMLGAALVMAYMVWRTRIDVKPAFSLVALLGMSPFFIEFRDEVRPDTAFLLLFLATLWLGDRWAGHAQRWDIGRLARGFVLGAVAYLAYGTRSLGLVLLPALWLVDLWRLRRPTPTLVIATLVCGVLVVLQSMWLHTDAGYAGNLTLDARTLGFNTLHYATSLSVLWTNPLPLPWGFGLRAALFASTLLLAAIGYVACVWRGISVLEVVPWLYFAPLVLYWVGTMIQQRYVLPLLPLLLYHAWVGVEILRQRLSPRLAAWALVVLGMGVVLTFGSGHAWAPRAEIRPGATDADAREVYAWLRQHSSADAVVLVGRARAFALHSQRLGVSPFGFRTDEALWPLIVEQRVTHVVVGVGVVARDMDYEHPDDLARFVAAHPQQLQPVLRNSAFVLYQVVAPVAAGSAR
jgi:Dolichyl-phosphate-mannose-protein mannosyltransferase